ncbi:hypothetical protein [Mucilaginibacter sp. 22184]|uniref:hypothetical protein n=1 Tax=Mucilaginibacter sp. 22184 TaxID=3453887 RepID=UPI003F8787D4
MAANGMQINVLYEQPVEIIIEFPLAVMCAYNGGDNLDITWDDHIAAIINGTLQQNRVYIKHASLDFPAKDSNDALFSSHMTLIVQPPGFDLNNIVDALTDEKFQKGLCIKRKYDYKGFETVYADPFAIK